MRVPIIGGNWKMNTTLADARELAQALKDPLDAIDGVEKVICPPFVSLAAVAQVVSGTTIRVGAQNMYFQERGAYTGEVSPTMLAGLCQYVILGHSERRQHFGETDALINQKVKAALAAGLWPLLCIGETLEEREAGRTSLVVITQLRGALEGIADPDGLVIAYEPIWAIGTGLSATPEEANDTIALIRREVAALYGFDVAEAVRIQYGGSVNPTNAAEIMAQPDIDGALVGGASLRAADFASIVSQTAAAKA